MPRFTILLITASVAGSLTAIALFVGGQQKDEGFKMRPPGTLTFSKDIAPLLEKKCLPCHYQSGPSPFRLDHYDEVRKRAQLINVVLGNRSMPPVNAASDFGDFSPVGQLSADEIMMFKQWSNEGAKIGDRTMQSIAFEPQEWQLREPDHVLELKAEGSLPEDGPPVFHIFEVVVDEALAHTVRSVQLSSAHGYVARALQVWVDQDKGVLRSALGYNRQRLPEGTGLELHKGEKLKLRVRFHPTGKPEPLTAKIGLFFQKTKPTSQPAPFEVAKRDFVLPAGHRSFQVSASAVVDKDQRLVAVRPEAKLFCRDVKVRMIQKDGKVSNVFWMPRWDPFWRGAYNFGVPVLLPKDSQIVVDWSFDNSAQNPRNPYSPPKDLKAGEGPNDPSARLFLDLVRI